VIKWVCRVDGTQGGKLPTYISNVRRASVESTLLWDNTVCYKNNT